MEKFECKCYFCRLHQEHTTRHKTWHSISSRLLVAESLDSKDQIPMKACTTCGHQEEREEI